MKHITFYLDFSSSFAYLAFEELPQALMGISHSVTYKPLLVAGLLKHYGRLGGPDIPAKREWTQRHVQWLAHSKGLPLAIPLSHPFNPLALLRLAVASDPTGCPNRYVCETVLRHVWVGGDDAVDSQRLSALEQQLSAKRDPASPEVKAQVKAHFDTAMEKGVFSVPTFEVDGKLFWGLDALPMLRAYLLGDGWFDDHPWGGLARS